jgi:heterodisulfide reductase subunit A-like polyferredoxin
MDAVLHHDRITVMTLSEVEEVRGFMGNFRNFSISQGKFISCEQ